MSALKFAAVGAAAAVDYVEDVFSTYLYTGNGATQTITNGIDLSTKGGLVWIKQRNVVRTHRLSDTVRGVGYLLATDTTDAQSFSSNTLVGFDVDGFDLDGNSSANGSGNTYASWTFRKQPKFFDVVTYTGNGVAGRTVAHSLGAVPGSIIVKRTDIAAAWPVYHNSLANTQYLVLNTTAAAATGATWWNSTTPTSSVFSVGTDASVNASGGTYVAYLFAHNAGGFGLTGTDNVISCGSFTTDGSGNATVNLGYEPQWVILKNATTADNNEWRMVDNMRGFPVDGASSSVLAANSSAAEFTSGTINVLNTGIQIDGLANSATFIYIAIRRGPMKVPTLGTSVFAVDTEGQFSPKPPGHTSGFVTDMAWVRNVTTTNSMIVASRLTDNKYLVTSSTAAEGSLASINFAYMNGWLNISTTNPQYYSWMFLRAPGFFDEVCYTGTGVAGNTVNHNLTVAPELIITKRRDTTSTSGWVVGCVYYKIVSDFDRVGFLNLTNGFTGGGAGASYNSVGASSYTLSVSSDLNASGGTFVAYLFASCPGVSKVGSYTGNGTSQTIACGFTAGARFILIKRTDSTGDWYVWDSARGIVAGNDPHLSLNTTAAEVTTDDSVDTDSSGFIVNQLAATNINVSAASYIFLAIS